MNTENAAKLFRLSIILIAITVLTLCLSPNPFSEQLGKIPPLLEITEQISYATITYIIVDFVVTKTQFREIQRNLQEFFNGDPSISLKLPLELRRRYAAHWLSTSSDDPRAKSALESLSSRYLDDKPFRYRISRGLGAQIGALHNDIRLSDDARAKSTNLPSSNFLRVIERSIFSFQQSWFLFYDKNSVSIIAALNDEQLSNAYGDSECIFRNMMSLNEVDRITIMEFFGGTELPVKFHHEKGTGTYIVSNGIVSCCLKISVEKDRNIVSTLFPPLLSVKYSENQGFVFRYEFSSYLRKKDSQIYFDVELHLVQSRSNCWYAQSFNEPTLGHYFEVSYDYKVLQKVHLHEFLSLSLSSPVQPSYSPGLVRINIYDVWIFPVSGAVLTWAY